MRYHGLVGYGGAFGNDYEGSPRKYTQRGNALGLRFRDHRVALAIYSDREQFDPLSPAEYAERMTSEERREGRFNDGVPVKRCEKPSAPKHQLIRDRMFQEMARRAAKQMARMRGAS